jgi:hypothetical protein
MQDIFDRGQATDVRAYGRSSPAVGGALPGTRAVRRVPMTADTITERILRQAGLEAQIADALNAIKRSAGAVLTAGIEAMFKRNSDSEWRDHIEACAAKAARLP